MRALTHRLEILSEADLTQNGSLKLVCDRGQLSSNVLKQTLFPLLRLSTLRSSPPMISPQLSLAIPICAAVYLLAVYLLLMLAQRNRLSRPR